MLLEDNFPQVMELDLSQARSMIAPHVPGQVDVDKLIKLKEGGMPSAIQSFGLFGDSPDYNTFYPGMTEEDWTPQAEDFIEPLFRLFSETIVVKHGVPIMFDKPGLLKGSMHLLKGLTVNADHSFESVGNALGSVSGVYWQESYKIGDLTIPAGVNGKLKLDAKSNPRIARGIMMDPPSIHSNSVTVRFEWEKSHPEMEDFWDKAGSFDKDGNLIGLRAISINSYVETSLVYKGADVFAQRIDESGKIVNPQYAKAVYAFTADPNCEGLKCGFDFRNLSEISNNADKTFSNHKNKHNMDFTQLLADLGLDAKDFKDVAAIKAHLTSLAKTALDATQAGTDLAALKVVQPELTPESLQALVDNQRAEDETPITEEQTQTLADLTEALGESESIAGVMQRAKDGDAHLQATRDRALVNYNLVSGEGNADEAITTLIAEATLAQAIAFDKQYQTLADATAPLTCQSCKSTDISRASHAKDPKEPKAGVHSYEDAKQTHAEAHNKKASSIHGK